MARDLASPLAKSLFDDDKPKKRKKVKSGGTTVKTKKSKSDGYVTKSTTVKSNGTEVTTSKKRKTVAKAVNDAIDKVSAVSTKAIQADMKKQNLKAANKKAKTDKFTAKRRLQAEKDAFKLQKLKAKKEREKLRKS